MLYKSYEETNFTRGKMERTEQKLFKQILVNNTNGFVAQPG